MNTPGSQRDAATRRLEELIRSSRARLRVEERRKGKNRAWPSGGTATAGQSEEQGEGSRGPQLNGAARRQDLHLETSSPGPTSL